MNKTETEVLLERVNLTVEEVYDIIRKGVTSRYKTMKQLRASTTIDDLVQDVFAFYLDEMASVGEPRLKHYIEKYNNREHIINLIKHTSYQLPVYYARTKEVSYCCDTLSFDFVYSLNDRMVSFSEMVADQKIDTQPFYRIMDEDFYEFLRRELEDANFNILKAAYLKHRRINKSILLSIDVFNEIYSKARDKTTVQLGIIKDLCGGYKAKELRHKYTSFRANLDIIKKVLKDTIKKYEYESA